MFWRLIAWFPERSPNLFTPIPLPYVSTPASRSKQHGRRTDVDLNNHYYKPLSLQDPVVGFTGGSAVLPCLSKERPLKLQEITVYWRYNDSLNVYDFISGQGSVKDQHSAYKGRAEMFSDDFEKGNFSLKLSNLQHNDTGKYICYESEVHTVELCVKEKEKYRKETKEHNQDQRRS
ncbi:Programmed cell death 1 ligand 1 [Labeo rohita]|uniref:Programmed cell death 1 ligand 1 n=1 Tax=Labeo rohita TaxID=84645 RepID=A0ABQ8L534_LABRO|nr:Programmed cell death 1 ligand 1 [Labeo rohita]